MKYSATIREPTRITVEIRRVEITGVLKAAVVLLGNPTALLSQAEYDALPVKVPGTYYFIRG